MSIKRRPRPQSGVSLIELVMFIVIVSIALIGVLKVMNLTTRSSANPMVQKQALAAAESIMDEVLLQAFTYCDPNDSNALTTASSAGCATTPEGMGPEAGETRYSNTTPFDNVNDYAGFNMLAGIYSIADSVNPVPGLEAYAAQVTLTQAGTAFGLADNTAVLRIDVRITGPGNTDITHTGYRFRYAPNAAP